jgi:hypothetical protein
MFSLPGRRAASVTGTETLFLRMPVLEAARARFQRGTAASYERETIVATVFENQRADGSWGGSLLRTAEALLLLKELRSDRTFDVTRAIAWIYDRQNAEGRFGDACDDTAHRAALCHHFASGFFAPAPPWVVLDGIRLDGGYSLGMDRDARAGVSALACSALLEWGEPEDRLRVHVDACNRIVDQVAAGRASLSTAAYCCVLKTLLSARPTGDYLSAVGAGLDFLVRSQRADGTWPGADMFLVLQTIASACERGHATPRVLSALRRSASIIDLMQAVGTSPAQHPVTPRQAWVAWRVMNATTSSVI